MKKIEINEELINNLKTYDNPGDLFSAIRLKEEIFVNNSFRHSFVCQNVHNLIKEYYYLPVKEIGLGWHNPHRNHFPPYLHLSNDLHIRIDAILFILEMIVENKKRPDPPFKPNEYRYVEDLQPFFEQYVDSFKGGFDGFLETYVTPHLLTPNDRHEQAEMIFDFIKSNWQPWQYKNGYYNIDDAGIYMGLTAGYSYRAWSIILYKERLFLPLFEESRNQLFDVETKYELDIEKVRGKHYALSYFLDCSALETDYGIYKQVELEGILFERAKGKKSGNYIRKEFDKIKDQKEKNIFNKAKLNYNYGYDWREIMLNLSEDPDKLDNFLESKNL